jgi:hypothetical protein
MTTEVDRKLWKYLFPVVETKVQVKDTAGLYFPTNKYKALIREDNNELIAIQKNSYKLVTNAEVIKPVLDELSDLTTEWHIDPSHSFVENARMRLQITFPEITLNDGESDIALSLFVHNSYDSSEGIRFYFGGIRAICGNGSVFGHVLAKFYAKHTSGIVLENLKKQIEDTYDHIPVIKERINILQNLKPNIDHQDQILKTFGKGVAEYVEEQPKAKNQWVLYNQLTHYISHYVQKRTQAFYQMKVSKMFEL